MKPYTPQDIARAGDCSKRALAALTHWREEEAKKLLDLATIQAERIAAEHVFHECEVLRTRICAPGALKPDAEDLR